MALVGNESEIIGRKEIMNAQYELGVLFKKRNSFNDTYLMAPGWGTALN